MDIMKPRRNILFKNIHLLFLRALFILCISSIFSNDLYAQMNLIKNAHFENGLNFWHSNSYGVEQAKPEIIDGELYIRSGHDLKALSVFQQEMIPLKKEKTYQLAIEAYSSSEDRPLEILLSHEDGGTPYFFKRIHLSETMETYAFEFSQPVDDPGAVLLVNYGRSKSDAFIKRIELKPEPGNPPYQLSIEKSGLGNVDITPMKNNYERGEQVQLRATPQKGYHFIGWHNQGFFEKQDTVSIKMSDDIRLNATFYKTQKPKPDNHRAIMLTDMGNEPDDAQTAVRLLMYANELDLEGIIAVTSFYQRRTVSPQLLHERIEAYSKIIGNLQKHDTGWPHPDSLMNIAKPGQPGYGMANVGKNKSSAGSDLIKKALLDNDPRPIHFCVNAGANTLAQALWELQKELSAKKMKSVIKKIRVYDDTGQDDAGAWIAKTFPDLFYIRSRYQVFAFGAHAIGADPYFQGPKVWADDPVKANSWSFDQHLQSQHQWADQHIRFGHGNLGHFYLERLWGFEGGGTSTWIGLVNKGLYDPAHMTWGGWGGRFKDSLILNAPSALGVVNRDQEKFEPFYMYQEAADTWPEGRDKWGLRTEEWKNSIDAPIWRWRRAYFNEFKARMDWSVKKYGQANHNPIIIYEQDSTRTIEEIQVTPGETLSLDVSQSYDPDGDSLSFTWWMYEEPSTLDESIDWQNKTSESISVTIPGDAEGAQLHLILEVWDNGGVPLVSYKRFVINVNN